MSRRIPHCIRGSIFFSNLEEKAEIQMKLIDLGFRWADPNLGATIQFVDQTLFTQGYMLFDSVKGFMYHSFSDNENTLKRAYPEFKRILLMEELMLITV